ncbi:lysozyme inhibitor LprI family protein [Granulosicoccus sp. 3-233]|uniref:lysozyme inhibitor LprI family protein n=1 Tax=Granulosicoccus sp. 3-233 TaxID=3417969 RepID=UPI003D35648D
MLYRGLFVALSIPLLVLAGGSESRAQEYNALEECIALSPRYDDIHNCMDNYLDLMDSSLRNITEYVASSLDGEARAGLETSQAAFVEYRRQNCLWYLEFSSPRAEAEQIAKNCLSNMSQQRLSELQALLRSNDGQQPIVNGFYVYGAERNSFQPCGSASRYWLEGDDNQVGLAQQQYLSVASSDLQVLYATFAGTMDEEAQGPEGHQGVFELEAVVDLRVPTESDCQLPGEALRQTAAEPAPAATVSTASDLPVQLPPAAPDDTEEQLIAYFGDWLVDCADSGGIRGCRLKVDLDGGQALPVASLSMIRQKEQATTLEVFFSEREIDQPARILWSVDSMKFGDIVGSEIRVDQTGTRQLVPASPFLDEQILPTMIKGTELSVEVLASLDDEVGDRYSGSLLGVTKAITFADDFIRNGGL